MPNLISRVRFTSPIGLLPAVLFSLMAGSIFLGLWGTTTEASAYRMYPVSGVSPAAASAFQSKLMQLSANVPAKARSLRPIIFTDNEVNSFFKYDRPTFLPPSVRSLEFHFKPDGIHGAADVNFDELKPSQQSASPLTARLLASIFRGTQHLTALGVLESKGGTGTLTIKDVHIGNTALSDWLVNFLIQTYVESEYKIDLSKPFLLPNHVTHIDFAPGRAILVRGAERKK
ncbi:MAG TPA: hypothetical protein VJW77_05130 [Terriglobia bacterium]|nr:hypothetical protein [Terriglobia bacterium]